MVIISHQREKCIGCNYCVEIARERWRMSKKDGKSVLLNAEDKKGFHTIRVNNQLDEKAKKCADVCPVKIIKTKT